MVIPRIREVGGLRSRHLSGKDWQAVRLSYLDERLNKRNDMALINKALAATEACHSPRGR